MSVIKFLAALALPVVLLSSAIVLAEWAGETTPTTAATSPSAWLESLLCLEQFCPLKWSGMFVRLARRSQSIRPSATKRRAALFRQPVALAVGRNDGVTL
ncbi:hypothetical protein CN084_22055 [Sinorhizobium medicae]|nr:hypothetical protein CN084_22055 [Sinorhizobium medicae]